MVGIDAQLPLPWLAQPLSDALADGELAAIAPRPVSRLGLLRLFLHGAMGRLGQADDIHAFSFRTLTVRRRLLPGRGRIKVAMDGEVSVMRMPLEFRVVEGQLLLLRPVAAPISK